MTDILCFTLKPLEIEFLGAYKSQYKKKGEHVTFL